MIEVSHLCFAYGEREVLFDVSFEVPPRGGLAIIGPSGCGKTTLLYTLAGLRRPKSGTVRIDGKMVQGPRGQSAVILQHYGLLPWKTVHENAALGLRIRRVPSKERQQKVLAILGELGMGDYLEAYPRQLSGGQQQRVAIARALALEPDLLIMDEPFSSLDALTREGLQNLLLDIWTQREITLVLVTHSIEEAVFLGQEVLVLSGNPGRVQARLPNAALGSHDFRGRAEYQSLCTELRVRLKGSMDGARV
jgi:NitT/TauT family transport system ATP-binding protein